RLHFGFRLLDAPAGSEAEVQVEIAPRGHHVASREALDAGHGHHLAVEQLADPHFPGRLCRQMREQRARLVDRVLALPGPRRMRAATMERQTREPGTVQQ